MVMMILIDLSRHLEIVLLLEKVKIVLKDLMILQLRDMKI
jgi:hypothetical protein